MIVRGTRGRRGRLTDLGRGTPAGKTGGFHPVCQACTIAGGFSREWRIGVEIILGVKAACTARKAGRAAFHS